MGPSALNKLLYKNEDRVLILALIASFSSLSIAFSMEIFLGLEPCILCHMQRVCVGLFGIISLIGLVHRKKSNQSFKIYIIFSLIFIAIGAFLAMRQLYLQNLPADLVPSCAPDFSYLIETMPIAELFFIAIQGDGNCAEVVWQFFGISLPGWVLIFLSLMMLYLIVGIKKVKTSV